MVDSIAEGVDIEVPVLIVGAGPAGLTLALALARYGVAALTVEKHPSTAHTPRAHIINQRTVEIFRALGISEARMERGNLRCDANVSLRPRGQEKLGTRTETKNVNSMRSVERAVRYGAYSFNAIERILAVQAKPKTILESLAEQEREHLQPLLDEDPVAPRPTAEYQPLIDKETPDHGPPRDSPSHDRSA